MRWWTTVIGMTALFAAAGSPAQDDGYWKRAFAAAADVRPGQPDGWIRNGAYWTPLLGPSSRLKQGPFTVDERLEKPAKALATCKRSTVELGTAGLAQACASFLRPSTRGLPGAAEARAIYEQNFEGTTGPVERMTRAVLTGVGAREELRAAATSETLNTVVTWGRDDELWTVGEVYAFTFKNDPELVQWLYDRGARLCEKDAGPPQKRFSCIRFYQDGQGGMFNSTTIADVLERNGFRPRTAAELRAAREAVWTPGDERQRFLRRYMALLPPAERARASKAAAARGAEAERRRAALAEAQDRKAGLIPATPAENLAAVRRLSEPGTAVCRPVTYNGSTYRFAATVEGASRTRLQLRAGSITGAGGEVTGMPFANTRVSPGVVFWDDAGLWAAC